MRGEEECGVKRENTEGVNRSGGGSQVHEKESNKQKANEHKDFDLAE